jgi:hypothetical protein
LGKNGRNSWSRVNIHIDGSQATVGDGAADSAGEGEAGVESEALELLGLGQRNLSSGHCD